MPDMMPDHFYDVTPDIVKSMGAKALICDIDNTLVAHDEKHPNEDVKVFVKRVKDSGIKMCLISNNSLERVETFAKDLNLATYPNARKPLKKTYKKILKEELEK